MDIGKEIEYYKNIKEKAQSSEINKLNSYIRDYIIKKECIIYGGTAIDSYLKAAGKKGIYSPDHPADYDCIHWDFINIGRDIADIFYTKGYKNTRVVRGIHPNTYRVFVNEFPIFDVSYTSKDSYEIIKANSIKYNDLLYVPIGLIMMDQYISSGMNMYNNINRLGKAYERIRLLENTYKNIKIRLSKTKPNKTALKVSKIESIIPVFSNYGVSYHSKQVIRSVYKLLPGIKIFRFDNLIISNMPVWYEIYYKSELIYKLFPLDFPLTTVNKIGSIFVQTFYFHFILNLRLFEPIIKERIYKSTENIPKDMITKFTLLPPIPMPGSSNDIYDLNKTDITFDKFYEPIDTKINFKPPKSYRPNGDPHERDNFTEQIDFIVSSISPNDE